MARYRKKAIVVEAERFFPNEKPWPKGVYKIGGVLPGEETSDLFCRIDTLEGPVKVSAGDWIVTGIKGERYPCKPDIFEATYEAVKP